MQSVRFEFLLIATLGVIASGCAPTDAEPDGPSAGCDDRDFSCDGIKSVGLDVSERNLPSPDRAQANLLTLVSGEPLRGFEITRQAASRHYEHQNSDGRDQAYDDHRIA